MEVSAAGGSLWRQRTVHETLSRCKLSSRVWCLLNYSQLPSRFVLNNWQKMACIKPWQIGWLSHVPSAWQTDSIVSVSGYRIWNPSWQLIMRLSPGLYVLFVTSASSMNGGRQSLKDRLATLINDATCLYN